MVLALLGGSPSLSSKDHSLWPAIGDESRRAVGRVLDRGVLSGATAPESVAFEHEFAHFVGAKYALLTHSGTSALQLALMAAGIRAGDHVLVPAYSFVATPLSVVHAGAIPIFVDVNEETGLMDPALARAAITSRTRAIMPVHVHGCPADMGALGALAEERGLMIIEDAAQAHGATWNGHPVGSIGRAAAFSLQSSKNLGVGEGGVVTTNDDALAEAANRIRNFGQDVALADREHFDLGHPLDGTRALSSGRMGWMYRGNELAAAMARVGLADLREKTTACQKNAADLSVTLSKLPGVFAPTYPEGAVSVHHKFRVRLDPEAAGVNLPRKVWRNAVMRALRAEGLEVVLWQVEPLVTQSVFVHRAGFGDGWPWCTDRETRFDQIYAPERFSRTQNLLDSSFILFSQSFPLIAQSPNLVAKYGEIFTKVWDERAALADWAKKNLETAS